MLFWSLQNLSFLLWQLGGFSCFPSLCFKLNMLDKYRVPTTAKLGRRHKENRHNFVLKYLDLQRDIKLQVQSHFLNISMRILICITY